MKRKFTLLIFISAFALLALCAIQAYLISNTYDLKKEAFFREADRAVSEISNNRVLDSLYDYTVDDNLANHIADYINGRISKDEVYKNTFKTANELNPAYIGRYKEELKRLKLPYEVKHQLSLTSIVIYRNQRIDTLYGLHEKYNHKLFGQTLDEDDTKVINTSRMFTTNEFVETTKDSIYTASYDLEVRTQERIVVKGWQQIIFKQMWVLMAGSVLLFFFVVGLLYYSIKNLITQKNIAEVKTDFINNITHELKTPLATLGIATKSLKKEAIQADEEAFNNTLGIVERQNIRLQKLIDQVLTNSLKAEELNLNREQIVDNQFFKELLADFETVTQQADVAIVNNIYKPEVILHIDRFHLTTAVLNILENAVKYGNEKVVITLVSRIQNGHYILEISDNGKGILESDQDHIFEKFYRVETGDLHNVKGLGLGLYFTHQIVTAHQGTIAVKSMNNKGTTFIIKIPI